MNRTTFIIDGFNLYHSIIEASNDSNHIPLKWLDIYSLCKSYLPLISIDAICESVYCFSSLPYHLSKKFPHKIIRHKLYIEALKSTGIKVHLGRFKEKNGSVVKVGEKC